MPVNGQIIIKECKEMGKKKVKQLVMYVIGGLIGAVSIYGVNPIGYGYFCGAVSGPVNMFAMMVLVVGGIVFSGGYIESVKYTISMMLFLVVYNLFVGRKNKNVLKTALIGAGCLFIMNLTKYVLIDTNKNELVMGVLESVFASAVSVFTIYGKDISFKRHTKNEKTIKAAGEARLNESAHMLNKLSGCFESLPVKKEVLNSQDVNDMFDELMNKFCRGCECYENCWNKFYETTCEGAYDIFCQLDKNKGTKELAAASEFAQSCPHYPMLINKAKQIFDRTKNNFLWYNRLIENRQAVALQLTEVARMMQEASEEICSQREVEGKLPVKIRKKMKLHSVDVKSIIVRKGKGGRDEYVLSLCTTKDKCVAVRDVAIYLSDVLDKPYRADKESRLILNRNIESILFVEQPNYRIIHGCARAAKSGERVLGDNFSFCFSNGQMAACLCDGMGSGLLASQSSELVIELLEGFLEAGFCKETALRMMNATLIMNSQNGKYSTIDVAEVDLYAGICEFVKMGAAVSFIKRENTVETVKLESLPVGSFYDQSFESATKTLYDGDYVILISDGVLAPLPKSMTEQVMAQLISQIDCYNPKEMANQILDSVLKECDYAPVDDMTVLVFGLIHN